MDEQADGQVGDILGVDSTGGGDPDAESVALGHVNVVGAHASGNDEAEGGEGADEIGGDPLHRVAEDGANGRGMNAEGGEKLGKGEGRGEEVEEVVRVRVTGFEILEDQGRTQDKKVWEVVGHGTREERGDAETVTSDRILRIINTAV